MILLVTRVVITRRVKVQKTTPMRRLGHPKFFLKQTSCGIWFFFVSVFVSARNGFVIGPHRIGGRQCCCVGAAAGIFALFSSWRGKPSRDDGMDPSYIPTNSSYVFLVT